MICQGVALSDSPIGLAAWILEKFYLWMDNDGDIEKVLTKVSTREVFLFLRLSSNNRQFSYIDNIKFKYTVKSRV